MVDACVITRPQTATGSFDPATGTYGVVTVTPVYAGRCRLRQARVQNNSAQDVAGDAISTQDLTLSVPADAAAVLYGDVVTLTAAPLHIRDLGTRFRITGVLPSSQTTAQRCQVEVVTG